MLTRLCCLLGCHAWIEDRYNRGFRCHDCRKFKPKWRSWKP